VPNLFALTQTETIDVHVSGPGGVVNQGMVAFTVDGQTVSASVDGNGNAVASLTLPLLAAGFPQNINADFSGANRSPASATQTALWTLWDIFLPSTDTFAADGGQSVQSYIFGMPFLDYLYTSSDQTTEVVLGRDWLSWDYSYSGVVTMIRLDGVLPVMVSASTPQGQFLGAVELTLSTDGTPVVESINAQEQVVASQPV